MYNLQTLKKFSSDPSSEMHCPDELGQVDVPGPWIPLLLIKNSTNILFIFIMLGTVLGEHHNASPRTVRKIK